MNTNQPTMQTSFRVVDRAVAYFFGMTVNELHKRTKAREVVVPRQIVSYLMRQAAGASLAEIGRHFGGQNRSTVRHSVARIELSRRRVAGVELAICGLTERLQKELCGHPNMKNERSVFLISQITTDGLEPKIQKEGSAKPRPIVQLHPGRVVVPLRSSGSKAWGRSGLLFGGHLR